MSVRFLKWCLAMFFGILLIPHLYAQPSRGERGRGERGRGERGGDRGRRGPDPEKIWGYVSRGKSTIKISDMRFGKTEAEAWAKKNGITNGQLTKDQFLKYAKVRMESRKKEYEKRRKEFDRRLKLPLSQQASLYLKERDKNKNGYIDRDEMDGWIRRYGKEYDKNGDGKFSRTELQGWLGRVKQRIEERRKERAESTKKTEPKGGKQRIVIEELPLERPLVFAFGKMPDGTPDWYTDNDTDKDGQVALYEWRKSGKSITEFLKKDTNQDGFISPDEMIRIEESENEKEASSRSQSSEDRRNRYRRRR
ncbi:MAG: hypothetical protein ACFCD0_08290 [Gemmataceae bacterium]